MKSRHIASIARDAGVSSEWGTVGWDDDASAVDFGAGTDDGMTLVKVTLYRGRIPGPNRPIQRGVATGLRVVAHLDARYRVAPANGTRVIVAFPSGDMRTPGNGAIIFVAAVEPTAGFDANTALIPVDDGKVLNIGDENAHTVAIGSVLGDVLNKILACGATSSEPALLNIVQALAGIYGAGPVTADRFATEKVKLT